MRIRPWTAQKLREIVFKDLEKKKKLESFQHPRISEEFIELVKQYAGEDPNAIIQVVVPLLIEVNMHHLFHNILMVYASEDEQKKRLMNRDGTSEEMAMNMIRSQLSVEEKKGFCDLIIDNSGSLEETRKQVEKLWQKLKKIQSERKRRGAGPRLEKQIPVWIYWEHFIFFNRRNSKHQIPKLKEIRYDSNSNFINIDRTPSMVN